MLFSLSKSFTSTGIGLAAAEGRLTIDDPVLPYFPDDAPADPSANLKAMRVRDLLAMSTGHHTDDLQKFSFAGNERLTKAFLALPVAHKPGQFCIVMPEQDTVVAITSGTRDMQGVLDLVWEHILGPMKAAPG